MLLQHHCIAFALLKDPGSSDTVESEGSLNTPADSGSPKRHFQEGAKEEQVSLKSNICAYYWEIIVAGLNALFELLLTASVVTAKSQKS